MKKVIKFDKIEGWYRSQDKHHAGMCDDEFEEYFDVPESSRTIWLTISTRKISDSYLVNKESYDPVITNPDTGRVVGHPHFVHSMRERLFPTLPDKFYVKCEHEV